MGNLSNYVIYCDRISLNKAKNSIIVVKCLKTWGKYIGKGKQGPMNSKVYYGNTFLDTKDLKETNIKNRIELEYYRTKKRKKHFLREDTESYGIEIVKKEYQGKKVNIEKEKIDKVSNKKATIDAILNKLKQFKVTPITLKDVVHDIMEN